MFGDTTGYREWSVTKRVAPLAACAAVWLAACGDPLEPVLQPLPDEPGEATLTDFRLGPLRSPAAFDLLTQEEVRTDQTFGWDFLFEIDSSGTPVLRPRGEVTGLSSDAGLQVSSTSFEQLTFAPSQGYVSDQPLSVAIGDVLAVVSRRDLSFGTVRCRRFAKIEILDIDLSALTLTFRHMVNPNCERLELTPESP